MDTLPLRLLAVEDDAVTQERYRQLFEHAHADRFEWRLAESAEEALRLLERKPFDAVLLDIGLPGMSGLDVLRWKQRNPLIQRVPVLVVSGQASEQDRIRGLKAGADDYLVKPFNNEELIIRLLKLKRRQDELLLSHGLYDLGWLTFDPFTCTVAQDNNFIHLEPKELQLLIYFLRRPRMVHRSHILWDMFWNEENPRFEHVLENKISSMRRKLGRGGVCLKNHKGLGYSFDPSLVTGRPQGPVKTQTRL